MSLIKCPECQRNVSDQAAMCPQCGYKIPIKTVPLHNAEFTAQLTKKRKLGCGSGILIMIGFIVVVSFLSREPKPPNEPCDTKMAESVIDKSQKLDAVHEIKKGRVYIKDAWYLLTIDQKNILDGVIQCFMTGMKNDRIMLSYRDFRSGKEIATSGPGQGLRME